MNTTDKETLSHAERPASEYDDDSLVTLFGEMCARFVMYSNKEQFDRAMECQKELCRRLAMIKTEEKL